MTDDIPDLPGYVSTKEAAKILEVSERRVRLYVEMKRLPAVRAARVLLIPVEEIRNFKRKIVGRPRKSAPEWRISPIEDTQVATSIFVQMRPHQEERLTQRLHEMRRNDTHVFPGTVARYIARSDADQVEITLIWRSTVMPSEEEREKALQAFRESLADVLNWSTAQYQISEVLMHT